MREPYGKAVAPRAGLAVWRCVRKDALQALAGMCVDWAIGLRKFLPFTLLRGERFVACGLRLIEGAWPRLAGQRVPRPGVPRGA